MMKFGRPGTANTLPPLPVATIVLPPIRAPGSRAARSAATGVALDVAESPKQPSTTATSTTASRRIPDIDLLIRGRFQTGPRAPANRGADPRTPRQPPAERSGEGIEPSKRGAAPPCRF